MILGHNIGVVGSRDFKNYDQLRDTVLTFLKSDEDIIISGGAIGADSMAQRFAKEYGLDIQIYYPKYKKFGKSATFIRNERIVRNSSILLAFYTKNKFQQGGTANSASWAKRLGVPLHEYEEI